MSRRLREIQRRIGGSELGRAGMAIEAIRIPLDAGTFLLVRDGIDEWVVDYYVSEQAEPWTMRLPAPPQEEVREPEPVVSPSAGATMGAMGRDDDPGRIPDGFRWCDHCNGYGSSLKDGNAQCARCHGDGADRRRSLG